MSGELAGKITIVTGAGAGIGHTAALLFAREGARLVVSDINDEAGKAVVREICEFGGDAIFHRADISREEDVIGLVARAETHFGRLDLAFNNAGMGHAPVALIDTTLEDWTRCLTVNLTGTFLCMKHEIPVMLKYGGGAIVNTSSQAGLVPSPMMGAYTASKFGLQGITRVAAAEVASRNIRVNAVCPTATSTPGMRDYIAKMGIDPVAMNGPMGRMGRPEEIAEVAMWLLSERASFVTGQAIAANGGSPGRTA